MRIGTAVFLAWKHRTLWRSKTPMSESHGAGFGFFHRPRFRLIQEVVFDAGTICTRSGCSGR